MSTYFTRRYFTVKLIVRSVCLFVLLIDFRLNGTFNVIDFRPSENSHFNIHKRDADVNYYI